MTLSMFGGDAAAKLSALDKSQAVIEFNMDGTIITANANFLAAVGYALSEIKSKHHSMFCDPAYAATAEYREFWAKLNRGEFQAAQYKRFAKGGKEIWIEASYNPLLRGGKPYKDPGQASQHVRRTSLCGERRIRGVLGQARPRRI
jgi:methyl-accepting chemotaxis protein